MNCNQARELLPAYVLGVLDDDELREVEAHVRAGHEHDEELVELRATVFALDRYADERSVQPAPAPPPREHRTLSERIFGGRARFGVLTAVPAWPMAMAAVVALTLFAAGWYASALAGGDGEHDVSLALQGSGGQSIALNGSTSEHRVSLTMSGFERLQDRVYQMWAIRDGTWVRIGVCNPDEAGRWEGEFPFEIRPGEQIAVTIEPPGGSDQPTSQAILMSQT